MQFTSNETLEIIYTVIVALLLAFCCALLAGMLQASFAS